MALLRVRVNDKVARSRLRRFVNPVRNREKAGRAAATTLRDLIKKRFITQGNPYGQGWKRKRFGSGRTLTKTGRLSRSIRVSRRGNVFVVGTTVPYARTHQFGAIITPKSKRFLVFEGGSGERIYRKRVVIPTRKFFPLTDAGVPNIPQTWMRVMEQAALRQLARGRL